eukprot:scaffold3352_cov326-Prasinococcus_capsulatus_cf.AAC.1
MCQGSATESQKTGRGEQRTAGLGGELIRVEARELACFVVEDSVGEHVLLRDPCEAVGTRELALRNQTRPRRQQQLVGIMTRARAHPAPSPQG